jgi:hypothetical protein
VTHWTLGAIHLQPLSIPRRQVTSTTSLARRTARKAGADWRQGSAGEQQAELVPVIH